jgi:hypothetical protein
MGHTAAMRNLVVVLSLLLPLTACGASASPALDLRAASLRLTDLPPGATAGPSRYWTDGQAAQRDHLSRSFYERHGRLRSYSAEFDRSLVNGLPPTGIVKADSELTEYRTVADARWAFLRLRIAFRHGTVLGTTTGGTRSGDPVHQFPYRLTTAQRIGNQSAAFFADWSGDEFAYDTRTIVFREGRVTAVVRISGVQDELPLHTAVAIAGRVQARIAAQLRRTR